MPKAGSAAQYIAARQHVKCTDIDSAVRLVQRLTSYESRSWSEAERKAVGGSLTEFLLEYGDYVTRIEDGCKSLLLQAAELIGRNHDTTREDSERRCADGSAVGGSVLEGMAGWLAQRQQQVGSEDGGSGRTREGRAGKTAGAR